MAQDPSDKPDRHPEEIKAEIEQTQLRLANTVDDIADRVAPKNVAARAQSSLKAQVIDPETGPRYPRIGAVAGVVIAIVGLKVWRSRR